MCPHLSRVTLHGPLCFLLGSNGRRWAQGLWSLCKPFAPGPFSEGPGDEADDDVTDADPNDEADVFIFIN